MTNYTMKGFAVRIWHCRLDFNCRFECEDTGAMRAHIIKYHKVDVNDVSHYGLSKHLANRIKAA